LIHGSVPDEFGLSTVIPISKGRNGISSDSCRYRGIALSSIFGKVLDIIILNRYADRLIASDLESSYNYRTDAESDIRHWSRRPVSEQADG